MPSDDIICRISLLCGSGKVIEVTSVDHAHRPNIYYHDIIDLVLDRYFNLTKKPTLTGFNII